MSVEKEVQSMKKHKTFMFQLFTNSVLAPGAHLIPRVFFSQIRMNDNHAVQIIYVTLFQTVLCDLRSQARPS